LASMRICYRIYHDRLGEPVDPSSGCLLNDPPVPRDNCKPFSSPPLAMRFMTIRTISTTILCRSQRGWIKCGMPPAGCTLHPAQLIFGRFLRFASFSRSIALHSMSVCRISCKACSRILIWIVVSLGYDSPFPSSIV
jgi:hypothetical protein